MIVTSTDNSDGTPNPPDANKIERWRSYLWLRKRGGSANYPALYAWHSEALEDATWLKWKHLSTGTDPS